MIAVMRPRFFVTATLAVLALTAPALAGVTIKEAGSTLLYPLVTTWATAYERLHGDVRVTTLASGSGAGVAAALDGSAEIGASDAYLAPDQERAAELVQIPLAISAQFVAVNVPGWKTPRLDGETLAGIYAGKIVRWNDARIVALNPGVALPGLPIAPLHRSDRSGDTYLFTSYLVASAPRAWTHPPSTSATWAVMDGSLAARGNRELLELARNTRGAIAYVGISLYAQAEGYGIAIAELKNRDGAFVAPSAAAVRAALARAPQPQHDGRISLIDLPGPGTYPIVNVEYAVVKKKQTDPAVATAIRRFLSWVIERDGGNAAALLDPVHFVPLTDALRAIGREHLTQIG